MQYLRNAGAIAQGVRAVKKDAGTLWDQVKESSIGRELAGLGNEGTGLSGYMSYDTGAPPPYQTDAMTDYELFATNPAFTPSYTEYDNGAPPDYQTDGMSDYESFITNYGGGGGYGGYEDLDWIGG